jgi:hypothetical protein
MSVVSRSADRRSIMELCMFVVDVDLEGYTLFQIANLFLWYEPFSSQFLKNFLTRELPNVYLGFLGK